MAIKLILTALYNATLAVILYLLDKKVIKNKISFYKKQILYGILFGLMAIFSSTNLGGVDIGNGIIMNVRDTAPLCTGLIFGGPSGIISGLIGGLYRYLATFYGLAGTYTQIACSISTILAGIIAAILRKYMFDNKKPTWVYGIAIGMICEVIHMLMIFFTNMNDVKTAFEFVHQCTLPMVLGNGISVGIAIFIISLLSKENTHSLNSKKQISQTFQFWLFICIVIAYVTTSLFSSGVQKGMSQSQTQITLKTNIDDVHQDIKDASNNNLLNKTQNIKAEYLSGVGLNQLANKYNVIEVNIINNEGIIVNSNNTEYIGYDMSSGEQSSEFLILLNGKTEEYVQDYRETSYDNYTLRKYGAIILPNEGFIQVGYDANQFRDDLDSYVGSVARNRHVGINGFVAICDDNLNIVTENNEYAGQNITSIGINLDLNKIMPGDIFETNVLGNPYLCEYKYVEGYYLIGAIPLDEAMFMREVSIYVSTFMQIIIFSILFVLIYFLIKKVIIDNIKKINNTLSQITGGNLDLTVDVRTNQEFASLSDDINLTVTALKGYIKEAEARIDKELEFAKQIQYSSLPTVFPNRKEFEIYAQMDTAKEVGGDFYDFYMLNDSTLAFLIADVSGKGIPAAMFMMKAKTIIKDLAESGLPIDEIFTKANQKLCENNDTGMFVTSWMGILDLKTGILQFANAGHNPPLIKKSNNKFEFLKTRSGLFLAGMDSIKYKKEEITLMPGDKLFLYTDGITEATNKEMLLYGEKKLENFINNIVDSNPKTLCTEIKKDVDSFVGNIEQFDDITMLAVSLNCINSDNNIVVIPKEESRILINNFADKLAKKLETIPKVYNKINIIFDELYSNIVNYSKAKIANISYFIENNKLILIFEDNGIKYNPLEEKEPDISLPIEERQLGGLGILMVKKLSDDIWYKYENNKNILRITISL